MNFSHGGRDIMRDKYSEIRSRLISCAENDSDIKCVTAIGSSTRSEVKADEYSDLDLMIAADNTERWLNGDYPAQLGNVSISFVEPTLGGGTERRVIYDGDKDVDMIIFTPAQFERCIRDGAAEWVMNRGYEILFDRAGFAGLISENVQLKVSAPEMSEQEFTNLLNDFYFHNIWAAKKLLRGEIWSAKMCVDSYLKERLLKIVELYCSVFGSRDVWHDGRFIDRWADKEILTALENCFARYEREDIANALVDTHKLFAELAKKVAENKGYPYPKKAEKCAKKYISDIKDKLT